MGFGRAAFVVWILNRIFKNVSHKMYEDGSSEISSTCVLTTCVDLWKLYILFILSVKDARIKGDQKHIIF